MVKTSRAIVKEIIIKENTPAKYRCENVFDCRGREISILSSCNMQSMRRKKIGTREEK